MAHQPWSERKPGSQEKINQGSKIIQHGLKPSNPLLNIVDQ
jgi:hypothetical protein